jgi:putative MFS transporter
VSAAMAYFLVPAAPLGIDGWRWMLAAGAVGAAAVWWIRLRLPESPRWLAQTGRFEEADRIVAALEAQVEREHGQPLPPVPPPEPVLAQGGFVEMWRPPYGRRTIMLIIFHVAQTVGYYGFANWVPTLLISQGITITTSLLYTAIIALAAPIGPLLGVFASDRIERKHVIVGMAAVNIVCGLAFSQMTSASGVIAMGVLLTVAGNSIAFTFLGYQQELYPTAIRARAAGFVYSWSRLSAVFNSFFIAFFLHRYGTPGVFLFIAGAMAIVMLVIGLMGPRTRNLALERVSG